MPSLLRDAQKDIDLKIQDVELTNREETLQNKDKGIDTIKVKVKGLEGERAISMNTHALENKINAIQIIQNLAANLGPSFFDFVEPVANIIVSQLLAFNYARAVRKEAAKCLPFLLQCVPDSN